MPTKLTPSQRQELQAVLLADQQEQLLMMQDRIDALEAAAREVIKWRGSPDTPWRRAVERLEGVLREGE
jgi:hypothetical protein